MSKAFTLIELLIVVAIIAILAAIAVLNFLEAQTRAKVSRSYSDMRASLTGLESYRIDWPHYPLGASLDNPAVPVLLSAGEPIESLVPYSVTTPVAYLTTLPRDPFPAKVEDGESPAHTFHYLDQFTAAGRQEPTLLSDYYQAMHGPGSGGSAGAYWLFTVGPDLEHDEDLSGSDPAYAAAVYDATNGTLSNGDIIFFQGRGL